MRTTKHILQCNGDDSNYFSAKFKVYFNTMADYSLSPPKSLLQNRVKIGAMVLLMSGSLLREIGKEIKFNLIQEILK